MSPRQLSSDEARSLSSLGNMNSPEAEHVIGIDALAVVVHPKNSLQKLNRGEIADILAGRVTRWDAVGGRRGTIKVYVGSPGVRAADTAVELLSSPSSDALQFSSDAGVIEGVSDDPDGIGIVSFPAASTVRTIPISEQGATSFAPSRDSISTQSYPLTRRLYFYVDPKPVNPNTRQFLSFVQGSEGQAVVGRAGYGSQNVQVVDAPLIREDASSAYRRLVAGASQLNTVFRFRTGVADLDNKALEDLERLTDFLDRQASRDGQSLILIGFADAQGEDVANLELSRQRVQAVAAALGGRNTAAATVRWFGEEQPVGDNSTVVGRERNRRVEVWLSDGTN